VPADPFRIIVRMLATASAGLRVIHLGPSIAVTTIAAALGAILLAQAGIGLDGRWLLMVLSVAGSQVFTGATNDLVDRVRDAAAGRDEKPIPAGGLSPNGAAWIASVGLAAMLAAVTRLGALTLGLSVAAVASAAIYNLFLSRTPLSPLPYVVSFGILPLWIAAGVGLGLDRVAAAVPLAAAFAVAAHLANTVRDFEADRRTGSRSLAQVLGRRTTLWVTVLLSLGVGLGVGGALIVGGRATPASIGLGVIGLAAVAQGAGSERRVWIGMLLAAVCWTAAWGLATG
jgi:4-hydroxybenzoate polyprenyltransferase